MTFRPFDRERRSTSRIRRLQQLEVGRGIAEIGFSGVAGAVANAVFNATGTRIRDLPITLDKLL